jgi:hypothetical protein
LFLEGDSFAEGLSNKPFTVPASGDTDFDMIVRTNFVSSAGRLVSRLNGRDQVQYVVEGKVLTDLSGLKKIPVPGVRHRQPQGAAMKPVVQLHVLAALPLPREILRHSITHHLQPRFADP